MFIHTWIRFNPQDLKKYRFSFADMQLVSFNETLDGKTHITLLNGVAADIEMSCAELQAKVDPPAKLT